MKHAKVLPVLCLLLAACGGTFPPPNERVARSEAAVRGAQEVGAPNNPQAALHLKLAQEEIDKAKALMADGQNKRADLMLQRAEADAELANLLAKEAKEKKDAEAALEVVNKMKK
jgi:hypothetical protein